MAENSKISWCDHTFNCWVGCSKVSEACKHCYAEGWAKRTGQPNLWQGERRRTSAANWKLPLKWQKEAEASGERARVFCASLADVFEDHPAIQDEWRNDLFKLIAATPNLDWLLLTKRPENAVAYLPWVDPHVFPAGGAEPWPNVWIGTTVENQQRADERIPQLLSTPAAVRFLSCEPLLGPIDLTDIGWSGSISKQRGPRGAVQQQNCLSKYGIQWVIVGGESGPNFRPFDLDWARSLQKQCEAAGVAFHFKQHGGRTPDAGGCLLDGKEYKAYPKAA